jgi:hypothetical protein
VYSLCSAEGHLKVVSAVGSSERGVVKGLWEEVMDQGTERHAITPTGREVLDIHILQGEREEERNDSITKHEPMVTQQTSEYVREYSIADREHMAECFACSRGVI